VHRWVVVVGNPATGYSIHGPFKQLSKAHDWIEEQTIVEHSVCVMELVDAREGYYQDDDKDDDGAETESGHSETV
jgi:hypothetical protein